MSEAAGDRAGRQDMAAHHEDEARGGRFLRRAFDMIDVERVDGEDVAMRTVALRRTRTAVLAGAVVVPASLAHALPGADGSDARGNVEREPMPVSASGRGVGVETGDDEALRPGGRAGPGEFRRRVAAAASGVYESDRDIAAFLE